MAVLGSEDNSSKGRWGRSSGPVGPVVSQHGQVPAPPDTTVTTPELRLLGQKTSATTNRATTSSQENTNPHRPSDWLSWGQKDRAPPQHTGPGVAWAEEEAGNSPSQGSLRPGAVLPQGHLPAKAVPSPNPRGVRAILLFIATHRHAPWTLLL